MKASLCISFRFIHPVPMFHGRGDGDQAEWPPSPMRAFQALLNAIGLRHRGKPLSPELREALEILETIRPIILATPAVLSTIGHRAYVPHNHADLVTSAWDRGNLEASIAQHRIEKDFRPHRLQASGDELPAVHFIYALDETDLRIEPDTLLKVIRSSVRAIHCLGWGIDQVVADATLVKSPETDVRNESWMPTLRGGITLRVPRRGSLKALKARHSAFLGRLLNADWTPVPPLSAMQHVRYKRNSDIMPRPYAIFRLLDCNDDTVTYTQSKLIHMAGMLRHLGIRAMGSQKLIESLCPNHDGEREPFRDGVPPRDLRGYTWDEWVQSYVAGHQSDADRKAGKPHAQFSYIPLQSIGHEHTDPGVRRVMIVAPFGDEAWLEHLASRLDGQLLKPLDGTHLPLKTRLVRITDRQTDGVRDAYLRPSGVWASVSPVILPGHTDRKPNKTIKLIEQALAQAGVEQRCEFEWSAFSHFRKMLPAHKYRIDPQDPDRKQIPVNYIRPDHLMHQTAVHLKIHFGQRENLSDPSSRWIPASVPIPGPIAIGAGRHCGWGVMAGVPDEQ